MTTTEQTTASNWFEETLAPDFLLRKVEWFLSAKYPNETGFFYGSFSTFPYRAFFQPEDAFVATEDAFEKHGLAPLLYACGKEYAYQYCEAVGHPKKSFVLRDAALRTSLHFFELMWDFKAEVYPNWKKSKLSFIQQGMLIFRKRPKAMFFLGLWAGFAAYLFNDKTIECSKPVVTNSAFGVKTKVDVAPVNVLKNPVARYRNFKPPTFNEKYMKFNAPVRNARQSLFNPVVVDGVPRPFVFCGFDFVQCGPNMHDLVETKLGSIRLKRALAYQPAFETYAKLGRNMRKIKGDRRQLACDFFTSCGWGLVSPRKHNLISITGFPYSAELEKIKMNSHFLGALDGLLFGLTDKKFKSKLKEVDVSQNRYDVLLELSAK